MKKSGKKLSNEDNKIPYDFASYIFGILSIVFAVLSDVGLGGIIFGIIGLVCAKKQKTSLSKKGKLYSLIGLILGLIFFITSVVLIIYAINEFGIN